MNRLKCFLTGAHKYSDANLISFTDKKEDVYVFYNYCVKCGKTYTVKVDRKNLFNDIPKITEEENK